MATNSVRVDDNIKEQAAEIAAKLGLTYNGIINVFLREFIRQQGFPFRVSLRNETKKDVFSMDAREVETLCKKAVRERSGVAQMPYTTIRDADTGKIYKQYRDGTKEEVHV